MPTKPKIVVPTRSKKQGSSKYAQIHEDMKSLRKGKMLEVKCKSPDEAKKVGQNVYMRNNFLYNRDKGRRSCYRTDGKMLFLGWQE